MPMKIKTKFLMIFICIVMICTVYITGYSFVKFRTKYAEDAYHDSQILLQQLSYNIDNYADEIYRLTLTPYYDNDIMELLEEDTPKELSERLVKKRKVSAYLESMMVLPRRDIGRVLVVTDDSYVVARYPFRGSTIYEQVIQNSWYQKALETKGTFMIFPSKDSSDKFDAFSVVNVINSLKEKDKIIGVIRVDASFTTLKKLCREVELGEEGGTAILSEDREIIFSNLDDGLQEKINYVSKEELKEMEEEGFLISEVPLKRFGWSVVSVYSLAELNRQTTDIARSVVLFCIVIIFLGSVALYMLLYLSLNPFYQILHLMQKVQAGNLYARYQGKSKDEFGRLGKHLNIMLDSLNQIYGKNMELTNEIYQTNLEKQEIQLNLLNSQIRPHFIYNTLNMIVILVHQGKRQEAIECINWLSIFLRGSAYIDKDIPLFEECRLLESYLLIQQARFGKTLRYEIRIPEKYMEIAIPSLTLQTIVENAVVHGYEKTREDMVVRIFCEEEEGILHIVVEDNGCGISAERLEQIRKNLQKESRIIQGDLSKEGGLGLSIADKRLKMRFGEEAGILMESQEQVGTRVYVVIPDIRKEKEEKYDSDNGSRG